MVCCLRVIGDLSMPFFHLLGCPFGDGGAYGAWLAWHWLWAAAAYVNCHHMSCGCSFTFKGGIWMSHIPLSPIAFSVPSFLLLLAKPRAMNPARKAKLDLVLHRMYHLGAPKAGFFFKVSYTCKKVHITYIYAKCICMETCSRMHA